MQELYLLPAVAQRHVYIQVQQKDKRMLRKRKDEAGLGRM